MVFFFQLFIYLRETSNLSFLDNVNLNPKNPEERIKMLENELKKLRLQIKGGQNVKGDSFFLLFFSFLFFFN